MMRNHSHLRVTVDLPSRRLLITRLVYCAVFLGQVLLGVSIPVVAWLSAYHSPAWFVAMFVQGVLLAAGLCLQWFGVREVFGDVP